jgi:hypothetical protein
VKILVLSGRHGLLPFAYRLKREGHDVEVSISKERYEAAWRGRLKKFEFPHTGKRRIEAVQEVAQEAGVVVLTDDPRWTRSLAGAPRLFALGPSDALISNPMLGAWFDGEAFRNRHLLIEERGLWPGGLGAAQPGAAVMVRTETWPHEFELVLESQLDRLKSAGFRGLCQVGFEVEPAEGEGEAKVVAKGLRAGWPFLQAHAFLSDCPSVGDILSGIEPPMPSRYVVVLPVSVPPWPMRVQAGQAPARVEVDLPREMHRHVFFHDIEIGPDAVRTAGLDGLVGVVRGSAQNLHLARSRALAVAIQMGVPEKQYRSDAGQVSEWALARLEELGFAV